MKRICKGCGREFETKTKQQLCGECPPLICKNCGKEFPFQLIRGKIKECCSIECHNQYMTKKEGYVSAWSKEKTKNSIRKTCLEKYNSASVLSKNSKTWDKIKQTNLERYGEEIAVKSDKVKQNLSKALRSRTDTDKESSRLKAYETYKNKYGENWRSEFAQKASVVKKSKYGEHLEKLVEKQRKSYLEKYGVEKYEQRHLPDELKEMLFDREKSIQFLSQGYSFQDLVKRFGCAQAIRNWIIRFNLKYLIQFQKSSFEKDIGNYLPMWVTSRKALIRSDNTYQEIDLYSKDLKIGIECNGNYWHSDLNKEKYYHFEKSKLAEMNGIRLIHIYEWEWKDPRIKKILLSMFNLIQNKIPNRIYARNCEIREISNLEARDFNNENHLQGHRNAQITYGLFYENKLVQLMSFSKTKYNRNLKGDNSWEIIRGCPGSNNLVVGGVSKLFKHFIDKFNPDKVFSYCDFNKFDGKGYEAIGMKFIGYTGPDKTWLINGEAFKRNPHKYSEYKSLSEAVIWGSGSKKYLWEKCV